MSKHLKFFIDGAWVDPVEPTLLDVIDPSTEEPFTTISIGSRADVDRAVAAAKAETCSNRNELESKRNARSKRSSSKRHWTGAECSRNNTAQDAAAGCENRSRKPIAVKAAEQARYGPQGHPCRGCKDMACVPGSSQGRPAGLHAHASGQGLRRPGDAMGMRPAQGPWQPARGATQGGC